MKSISLFLIAESIFSNFTGTMVNNMSLKLSVRYFAVGFHLSHELSIIVICNTPILTVSLAYILDVVGKDKSKQNVRLINFNIMLLYFIDLINELNLFELKPAIWSLIVECGDIDLKILFIFSPKISRLSSGET